MFGFGSQDLIAVDIGSSSVKLAELDVSKKGVILKKFTHQSLPPNLIDVGEIKDPTAVAATIQNLIPQLKTRRKYAASAVWGSAVLVKKINMPQMEPRLLAEQIRWEAEQYIPFDINEVAIDYHVLNRRSGDSIEILLIAAKQEYLFRTMEAVETANLKCAVVDVAGLALANCFEVNYGVVPGIAAILNIGAGVTNLVILEDGEVIHARDLAIGGMAYTNEIHKNLGLSLPEAESMKMSASTGQEIPREVNDIVKSVNDQVVDEVRSAFEFVITASNLNMAQARVFVTGGSSNVPGLVEAISRSLGTTCEIFDPFLKVKYDSKSLSTEQIQGIRSICATAIGLGLRKPVEKR
jgi:type IV pilus assembly protein PilM